MQIFDSWGGALAHREYIEFHLIYAKIVAGLQREKMAARFRDSVYQRWWPMARAMVATGADAFGLDWTTPLNVARQTVVVVLRTRQPGSGTLYGIPDAIAKATKLMLDDAYANGEKPVM